MRQFCGAIVTVYYPVCGTLGSNSVLRNTSIVVNQASFLKAPPTRHHISLRCYKGEGTWYKMFGTRF